jgi:hypothetical protein
LDWENPVPENGFKPHVWIDHFIPHYDRMLVKISEVVDDPLTRRELECCNDILDLHPQPENAAEANKRLRQFVKAVRKVLKEHNERQHHMAKLAEARRFKQLAETLG